MLFEVKNDMNYQYQKSRFFNFLFNFFQGAVLLRSSQPLTTLFSWRNPDDERIIEEVIKYTKERNKGSGKILFSETCYFLETILNYKIC